MKTFALAAAAAVAVRGEFADDDMAWLRQLTSNTSNTTTQGTTTSTNNTNTTTSTDTVTLPPIVLTSTVGFTFPSIPTAAADISNLQTATNKGTGLAYCDSMSGTGLPFITTTVCAAAEGATTADVYWGGSVTWGSDFSAGTASGAADLIPRRLASHVAAKGVSYSMALTAKPVDAADQTASAAIMATATANVNSNLATAVSSKVATELATLPGNYTINAPTVSVAAVTGLPSATAASSATGLATGVAAAFAVVASLVMF